jgi:hypothetical protein
MQKSKQRYNWTNNGQYSLACQGLMPEDLHVKGKQTLPYNCECVS